MIPTIPGSGGRIHTIEQAASLHHLADELARDLNHWGPHLTATVCMEVRARIERLRAQATEYELAVVRYDRDHAC